MTRQRMRILATAGTAFLVLAALITGGFFMTRHAQAAPQTTYYASPSGAGTSCSSASPCSITQAQANVRTLEAANGGNVTVLLANGTYRLSAPLSFGAADGGSNGATVTWAAASGATPIISGALQATGWTLYNSSTGVYVANTPVGLESRDLFVNNALASRAAIKLNASDITLNSTGFTINNAALNYLSGLPEQNRIELETTESWTDRYSPVASITGTTVTMAQPAWNNNTWGWDTLQHPLASQTRYLENSLSFLTQAGQWFIDPTAGKLYYKPATGVDPNTLDIELPKLQSLIDISGTYASPVTNLSFQGLQFSHTSWLGPSSTDGYTDQQTGTFLTGAYSYRPADAFTSCSVGCAAFERARTTWNQIPAAVQVSAATGVTFTGNMFAHLGQVALGIGEDANANASGVGLGANTITVTGNIFTDNGGGGMIVGGVQADANHPSDTRMTNQNIVLQNNTISGVSLDYKDNAGILSTYVTGAQILHNEVENLPYDGIDTGYGWGVNDAGGSQDYANRGYYTYNPKYTTPTTLKNNLVASNLVHHTKTVFADGGSIYNLSASPGTVIRDNYIYDLRSTTGLYLDEGSRYITLENNVVQDAVGFGYLDANTHPSNNTHDNTADNTWHNSGNVGGTWNSTTNNVITNDHPVSGTNWLPRPTEVICNAGVEPAMRTSLNANYQPNIPLCGWSNVSSSYQTTASTTAAFAQNGWVFALTAAGADIWTGADAYGAVYQPGAVTSGTQVTARVDLQSDINPGAKTGVVIRNNLTQAGSSAGYAIMVVTPGNSVSFQWDSTGSGHLNQNSDVAINTTIPTWVRLVRTGTQVSGYYSQDGTTFTQVGSTVTLTGAAATQDGGIITASHDATQSAPNFVSNLQIKPTNAVPTSGLALWLRGDAGVTLNGNAVASWADQSGNGNNATQATGTAQPTYVTGDINGNPALRFDGINTWLQTASPVTTSTQFTMFVVSTLGTVAHQWGVPGPVYNGKSDTNGYGFYRHNSANYGAAYGNVSFLNFGPVSTTGAQMQEFERDGTGTATLYVNGTQSGATTTATPNTPNTGTFIGSASVNSVDRYTGDVAEVLIYNRPLSTAERQQVETYLTLKYLSPIPANGLALWLRGDAGVTLNGTTVATWADQSGNGNDTIQTASTAQPTYVTGDINGKPALRFDGINGWLQTASPVTTSTQFTMFVVGTLGTVAHQYGTPGPVYNGDSNNNGYGFYRQNSADYGIAYGKVGFVSFGPTSTTGAQMQEFERDGTGTATLYVNGTQSGATTTATPNTPDTGTFIGAGSPFSADRFTGDVAEVLIYNRPLSTTERQQVETYLAAKYQLP